MRSPCSTRRSATAFAIVASSTDSLSGNERTTLSASSSVCEVTPSPLASAASRKESSSVNVDPITFVASASLKWPFATSELSVARMIAVSSEAVIPGDVRTDDSAAFSTDF